MSNDSLDLAATLVGPAALVIRLTGPLDRTTAPDLRASLAVAIAGGFPTLVLDLAGVTRGDSSGLAAVVEGLRAAHLAGGDLVIAAGPAAVSALLRVTALDRVLVQFPDVPAAVAAVRGTAVRVE